MTNKVLVSFISGTLMMAGHAFGQRYTFVPIDVQCPAETPAPDCPAGLTPGQAAAQTGARGINARGDVVGFYAAGGRQHGFLLKNGHYTSLDFPLSGVRATSANGINPRGEIVGQYTLPVKVKDENGNNLPEDSPLYCPPDLPTTPPSPNPACIKGFYYRNGQFSTVMFPSTKDANGVEHKHPGAIAQRISPDGDIYGCLHDQDLGPSMFGAAWRRFETFSLTDNGGELSDPMGVPMSMNNGATPGGAQTIVGFFMDMAMASQQHGFLVRNGMLESYDPTATTNLTAIWDINPSQQFVGTYRQIGEPPAKRHGFLQNPPPSEDSALPPPTTLDVHFLDAAGNTVNAFATVAFGINPGGVIVGQYALISGGAPHGFIAMPPDSN